MRLQVVVLAMLTAEKPPERKLLHLLTGWRGRSCEREGINEGSAVQMRGGY